MDWQLSDSRPLKTSSIESTTGIESNKDNPDKFGKIKPK